MSEVISKQELSNLLHSIGIPVNEGAPSLDNEKKYPKIIYWPYIEQDNMSSGNAYNNLVTYQISFFANTPQHEKWKELRRVLRDSGIHPVFNHEYVEKDPVFQKKWHTFFSVDVLEEIE